MTINGTLDAIARLAGGLGEWNVYDTTPQAVEVPALFPGAVEELERQSQDGERTATLVWWVAYAAGEGDTQRRLYDAVERLWDALDEADDLVATIRTVDSFGVVTLADTQHWGARLVIEAVV